MYSLGFDIGILVLFGLDISLLGRVDRGWLIEWMLGGVFREQGLDRAHGYQRDEGSGGQVTAGVCGGKESFSFLSVLLFGVFDSALSKLELGF